MQNSFYYFFSSGYPIASSPAQPGVPLGLLRSPPWNRMESNPEAGPLSRPLDVFTMNPYLPACQCDIYVTRYCVSERVIEIFPTGQDLSLSVDLVAISLADSATTIVFNDFVRLRTSVPRHEPIGNRCIRWIVPDFQAIRISPLAKFIREHVYDMYTHSLERTMQAPFYPEHRRQEYR